MASFAMTIYAKNQPSEDRFDGIKSKDDLLSEYNLANKLSRECSTWRSKLIIVTMNRESWVVPW